MVPVDSLRPENVSRAQWIDPGGERGGGERATLLSEGEFRSVPPGRFLVSRRRKKEGEMIVPRVPLSLVATTRFITSRGHHGVFRERAWIIIMDRARSRLPGHNAVISIGLLIDPRGTYAISLPRHFIGSADEIFKEDDPETRCYLRWAEIHTRNPSQVHAIIFKRIFVLDYFKDNDSFQFANMNNAFKFAVKIRYSLLDKMK